jgi:CBS domain-containing protein
MMLRISFKFFKKFILEEEGQNKDKFDIKTRAIMLVLGWSHLLVLGGQIILMLDLSNL